MAMLSWKITPKLAFNELQVPVWNANTWRATGSQSWYFDIR
jgi:hypothetical protein